MFDLESCFHSFQNKKIVYNLKTTGQIFVQFYTVMCHSWLYFGHISSEPSTFEPLDHRVLKLMAR